MKASNMEERNKTVLLSADIIVYVENLIKFIEKILELISDFYKTSGCKININTSTI